MHFLLWKHAVADAWQNQHEKISEQAARLTASLSIDRMSAVETLDPLAILEAAAAALEQAYDATHGGFGGPPKFPHPLEIKLC